MIVLKCAGFPDGSRCSVTGQYLKSFDPEANNGGGDAVFTPKKEEAIQFQYLKDAIAFYHTIPTNKELRDDGEPNRPLTTFSMGFIPL